MANTVELATAYLNLVPSLEGATSDIGKQLGGPSVQNAVGRAGDKAGKTYSSKFSKAGSLAAKAAGLGIAAVATAGAAWAVQTAKDLANVQRIGAQTEAVIRATGGAAGRSRSDVDRLAGSIERMSGVEAETVTEGQNMLLTFKNIKGQRFDQATTAMTDMAVAMNKGSLEGLDMRAASIQLGKALNDPIKGVSALAKVGVQFSDQQKEQIKTMVESGNISQAQGVILKELNSQFGGAARAAGETFQGKIAKLNNAFGNFSEGLLAWTLPALEALVGFLLNRGLPALENLGSWLSTNVVPAVRDMAAVFRDQVLPVLQGSVLPVLGSLLRFLTSNWKIVVALGAAVLAYVAVARTVTAVQIAWAAATRGYATATAFAAGVQRGFAAAAIGTRIQLAALAAQQLLVTAGQRAWIVVTKAAAVAQRALNLVMRANPIGLIITAIGLLVGALVWFFTKTTVGRKIVAAAWSGIKAAISAVSSWWTKTAWPAIRKGIDAMGRWFRDVGRVISAVWSAIRSSISTAWNWIRDQVFARIRAGINLVRLSFQVARVGIAAIWAAMRQTLRAGYDWVNRYVFAPFKLGLQVLGTAFRIQKDRIVSIWNSVLVWLDRVGGWIRQRVFSPLSRALGLVGDAFRRVPGVVKSAWDRIKGYAARPVNFVIETVYGQGIKRTWDRIADAVGLNLKLPTVRPIAFANGSEDHRAQIARGGAMRLWAEPETGGEAYIPLAQSKRGRSTAILGTVARQFGYSLTPFADGGWFGDVWDKIKSTASGILSGPSAFLRSKILDPVNRALGSIGGGQLGKIAAALPRKIIGGLIEKAKDLVGSIASPGGGGGKPAGAMGWRAMWSVVKNQFPTATLNSAYRPGAITAVGTPSYHGQGRAIDITPSMAIFNWLAKTFPNSTELIFSPAGMRQLWNGRNYLFGEPTRGDHWDHVHWAMANGGIFSGIYDQGGWMPHGGVGLNLSGKPEAVLDPDESIALKAGLGRGPLVGQMVVADPREAVYRLEQMQRRARVRAGLRG